MLTLKTLQQEFSICRLAPDSIVPDWIWTSSLYSITKTADELSLVCEQTKIIPYPNMQQENSWRCLQVLGPLDFALTGILSSIAQPLAHHAISIFAFSTYDTDYIMVKNEHLRQAKTVLKKSGFIIL